MLASGRRGRDTDDLAGAALEHQDIAHADVVARDGDSVGDSAIAGAGSVRRSVALTDHLNALALRVEDTVSHLV